MKPCWKTLFYQVVNMTCTIIAMESLYSGMIVLPIFILTMVLFNGYSNALLMRTIEECNEALRAERILRQQ